MRIAVMGTGGTGGYYGALLARSGQEVSFLARGAHLRAIREKGLQIKSVFGDFSIKPGVATDKATDIGAVDLLLFCTKTYDTDQAAQAAKPLVGPQTSILSIQNGVDAAERLGVVLGREHMLAGATWISSAIEAPGIIRQASDFRRLVFGELDGSRSQRSEAIFDAFQKAGITVELSTHVLEVLWTKFVFISAVSAFGSLTRLPVASYRGVPETRALLTAIMHEVAAVARASGIDLPSDVVDKALAFIDSQGPNIKASMQLDVESGHRTELESIIGVIGRKGREMGVQTPVADFVYASLLPLELKSRSTQPQA